MGLLELMSSTMIDMSQPTTKTNYYFAVFGDSIARGPGEIYGPNPNGVINEWNGTSFDAVGATDLADANIGSAWMQFGIDYNVKKSATINLSHSGFGGSEFSPDGETNNWSDTGIRYEPSKDKAIDMMADVGLVASDVDGILLILGINDARGSATYVNIQADMQDLVDRINTDFGTPNIYLSQIGTSEAGDTQRVLDVRGFLVDLVANNANVFMAYALQPTFTQGNGLLQADNLHPTQDGNNLIGAGFSSFIN